MASRPRTKPPAKVRKPCLGPGAVSRPHLMESTDDGNRVCKACRLMQDRMRTPPMILKCAKEPSWE